MGAKAGNPAMAGGEKAELKGKWAGLSKGGRRG